jgi:large subunit ribosomal protein L32
MAQPKKKTTHSRKAMGQWKERIEKPNLVECPHCHNMILPHKVCPYCGYYDGEQVLAVEKKKKKKE